MTVEMGLNIQQKSDSIYAWEISYKMKGKEEDIRKYELIIIDKKKGHYIIDEKNTIKIDAFYRNKIVTSFFKVMQSFIVSTQTKVGNDIIFEIIAASDKKTTITGNTSFNGENIPKVETFFINGRQKAILKKQ